MSRLFTEARISSLVLPNRLVRSATAERMADAQGRPTRQLQRLYQELVRGGVGLIVTGDMYIHPSGQTHRAMTGIHADSLIPALKELATAVHREGGRVVAQLIHGGMKASPEFVADAVAPSRVDPPLSGRPAREMEQAEVLMLVATFAQAARRARLAGFDGVQIHAAHGYLVSQFLSPLTNSRTDGWGRDLAGRARFLTEAYAAMRREVGSDYPVLIKLGVMDDLEGGLDLSEGIGVVVALEGMGLDAVEVSGGLGTDRDFHIRPGINGNEKEAYFLSLARRTRSVVHIPVIAVGGFRSRQVMEGALESGGADLIALSRPLICEPSLPKRLESGELERSSCASCNRCWPDEPGLGISCKRQIPASLATWTGQRT